MEIVQPPSTPRKRKYPWHEWTDGQARRATRGQDFDCLVPSFVALLHYTAKSRDFDRVETVVSEDGDSVTFQFFAKEDA